MNSTNLDTLIVISFFMFFILLTFYYVGIRMRFIKQAIDKIKNFFKPYRKPKPMRIRVIPPELISTKYNKLSDFLTGRIKLQTFDSSISLFLSNVTPVILIGVPSTVYLQGAQYFASVLSFPIAISITNFVFVPVFFKLQVKTANQYIGKRFNFMIKSLCIGLGIVTNLIKMGIWLNTPNLILTNFTVISNESGVFLTVAIVVIYTSMGGMTVMQKMERFQLFLMLFSLTSVVTKGIAEVGGIQKIIEENNLHNRLMMNFDLNPFTNIHTFWLVLFSNTYIWLTTYSIQQSSLNRYLNSGSVSIAQRIIWSQVPMMMLFFFVICFIGLLVYTFYFRCDPLMTARIDRLETLIALFSSDMTYDRSGLLGLFIVAIYSITLSSISSSLNGLSTIVFEDIIKFYDLGLDSKLFIRISMCVFGIVIVITMLFVQFFFIQTALLRSMLTNVLNGPVFGLFLLGLHTRRVNSKCALIALIVGLIFGLFIFWIKFQDSDKYTSIGIGFEDCMDYFCTKRSKYCTIDEVTHNKTLNVDISILKKKAYRYPVELNVGLIKYLNYMCDGWLISFFTVAIGLLTSIFINDTDKDPYELEECLATYMRKPKSSMMDAVSSKLETERETTYIFAEDDEKNKDESKDDKDEKDDKDGDKKDDKDKYRNEKSNVVDLNYLKKAIDDLLLHTE